MWPGLPFGLSVKLPGLYLSRGLPSSPGSSLPSRLSPFLSSPHAGLLLAVCQALENSTSALSGESRPLVGDVCDGWEQTSAGGWSLPSEPPAGLLPFPLTQGCPLRPRCPSHQGPSCAPEGVFVAGPRGLLPLPEGLSSFSSVQTVRVGKGAGQWSLQDPRARDHPSLPAHTITYLKRSPGSRALCLLLPGDLCFVMLWFIL